MCRKTGYIFDNIKCVNFFDFGYYQLNNIGTISSKGNIKKFIKYNFLFNDALSFITWNVCSYKCIFSYKKAKLLENFLKKYDDNYLTYIYKKVKVNYIYRNYTNFWAFNDKIIFDKVYTLNDVYYGIITDTKLQFLFRNSNSWFIKQQKDHTFVEFNLNLIFKKKNIVNGFKVLNFK